MTSLRILAAASAMLLICATPTMARFEDFECRLRYSDDLAECRKYYDRDDPRYENCLERALRAYEICKGAIPHSSPPDLDTILLEIFNPDGK